MAVDIISPTGSRSHFSASEVCGAVDKGRGERGREAVCRTVFRAIEGGVMDVMLRRFMDLKTGGQLVLPIFDAMIIAAPDAKAKAVTSAIQEAAQRAAQENRRTQPRNRQEAVAQGVNEGDHQARGPHQEVEQPPDPHTRGGADAPLAPAAKPPRAR